MNVIYSSIAHIMETERMRRLVLLAGRGVREDLEKKILLNCIFQTSVGD